MKILIIVVIVLFSIVWLGISYIFIRSLGAMTIDGEVTSRKEKIKEFFVCIGWPIWTIAGLIRG